MTYRDLLDILQKFKDDQLDQKVLVRDSFKNITLENIHSVSTNETDDVYIINDYPRGSD